MHNRRCSEAQPTDQTSSPLLKPRTGRDYQTQQSLSRPCRAWGKWENSCFGGCASLHRRLCISPP
ncbi:MAG: hypothetical protein LBE12_08830 [Planctomycetaceae bacterium]|nr:hypothetical protein [Planctomycetaceae bacterium]